MLTVWGRRTSANVQKVLWLLGEAEIPWRHRNAGGNTGTEVRRELLARNPNGLVPVIEDQELILWESNAILRHLARSSKASDFYDSGTTEQALIDQWMDWQLATLWPPMRPFFIGLARTPSAERDHEAIEAGRQRTRENLDILESWLRTRGTAYIVGDGLSLADIALGPFIHRWLSLAEATSAEQRALHALYRRYRRRPAFREHVLAQPF